MVHSKIGSRSKTQHQKWATGSLIGVFIHKEHLGLFQKEMAELRKKSETLSLGEEVTKERGPEEWIQVPGIGIGQPRESYPNLCCC